MWSSAVSGSSNQPQRRYHGWTAVDGEFDGELVDESGENGELMG